jgi:hypothetical protein
MTASVETLREIMLDETILLREAAEQILSFEASVDAMEEARECPGRC